MLKTAIPSRLFVAICLAVLSLSSVALSACGGSSKASTSASSAPAGASVAPSQTTTTATNAPAKGVTAARQRALAELLRKRAKGTAPNSSAPTKPGPARTVSSFKNALLSFTSCLRNNGVKLPSANGKSPLPSFKGVKTNTPQFRAASTKCRASLLASLRQSGLPSGARAGSAGAKR